MHVFCPLYQLSPFPQHHANRRLLMQPRTPRQRSGTEAASQAPALPISPSQSHTGAACLEGLSHPGICRALPGPPRARGGTSMSQDEGLVLPSCDLRQFLNSLCPQRSQTAGSRSSHRLLLSESEAGDARQRGAVFTQVPIDNREVSAASPHWVPCSCTGWGG